MPPPTQSEGGYAEEMDGVEPDLDQGKFCYVYVRYINATRNNIEDVNQSDIHGYFEGLAQLIAIQY